MQGADPFPGFFIGKGIEFATFHDFLVQIQAGAPESDLPSNLPRSRRRVSGDDLHINPRVAADLNRLRNFRTDGVRNADESEICQIFGGVGQIFRFSAFAVSERKRAASFRLSGEKLRRNPRPFTRRQRMRPAVVPHQRTVAEDEFGCAFHMQNLFAANRGDAERSHHLDFR